MVNEVMDFIEKYDPEVGAAIKDEAARQRRNLELIASENIVSEPVMMAMGTVLTNKYAEGYSGKRYYGGCEYIDVVETIAIERAKKLFGCDYANVQPHSGAQANMAVFMAMLEAGDTVMGMSLDCGGHLTHGSPVNFSGKYFHIVPYGVNDEGYIDYDEVEKLAMENKPKLIVAGASAYARVIDFKRFREIADKCGAYLMVDMAHIAGLVAAGLHPSPIPYADVVTTTTHKTLRGPRGGLILANKEAAEKFNFNKAIFPGTQGGPLEHIIAAKAVCFGEALKPEFKEYQQQIIKNAQALAAALQKQGLHLLCPPVQQRSEYIRNLHSRRTRTQAPYGQSHYQNEQLCQKQPFTPDILFILIFRLIENIHLMYHRSNRPLSSVRTYLLLKMLLRFHCFYLPWSDPRIALGTVSCQYNMHPSVHR